MDPERRRLVGFVWRQWEKSLQINLFPEFLRRVVDTVLFSDYQLQAKLVFSPFTALMTSTPCLLLLTGLCLVLLTSSEIVFNELLTHTDPPDVLGPHSIVELILDWLDWAPQWRELRRWYWRVCCALGPYSLKLRFYLSDDPQNWLKHRIQDNTIIPAYGYHVIYETAFSTAPWASWWWITDRFSSKFFWREFVSLWFLRRKHSSWNRASSDSYRWCALLFFRLIVVTYRGYGTCFTKRTNIRPICRFRWCRYLPFYANENESIFDSVCQLSYSKDAQNSSYKPSPVIITEINYDPLPGEYEWIKIESITNTATQVWTFLTFCFLLQAFSHGLSGKHVECCGNRLHVPDRNCNTTLCTGICMYLNYSFPT